MRTSPYSEGYHQQEPPSSSARLPLPLPLPFPTISPSSLQSSPLPPLFPSSSGLSDRATHPLLQSLPPIDLNSAFGPISRSPKPNQMDSPRNKSYRKTKDLLRPPVYQGPLPLDSKLREWLGREPFAPSGSFCVFGAAKGNYFLCVADGSGGFKMTPFKASMEKSLVVIQIDRTGDRAGTRTEYKNFKDLKKDFRLESPLDETPISNSLSNKLKRKKRDFVNTPINKRGPGDCLPASEPQELTLPSYELASEVFEEPPQSPPRITEPPEEFESPSKFFSGIWNTPPK